MKPTTPRGAALIQTGAARIEWQAAGGERFAVSVLEDDIVRVQFQPDGAPRVTRTWIISGDGGDVPLEGRQRDDLTPFGCPAFALTSDASGRHELQTAALSLLIRDGDFGIDWRTADGLPLAGDLPRRAYVHDARGRAVWHYLRRAPHEHYYGFGEVSGPLDKHGARLRMLPKDALGYDAVRTDPLYKHWPFYITYNAERGIAYGLLYDTHAEAVFDMGQEINALRGAHRYAQFMDGDIDYYFVYGPTFADVLAKFARLTGYPALLPRYTLGYMASTMLYTEAPDAQRQLEQFIAECAEHDIPCDLFHMSSGYTVDASGARMVFTWNRDRVPDPHGLAAAFNAAGMRLAANIKPHLLTDHPRFAEVAALGGFIKTADGSAPDLNMCWRGGLEEFWDGAFIDFTSRAGFDWWRARCTDALLDYGIEGLWNDNNEFEVHDDAAVCDGFGEPLPASLARPLQTLLMARASHSALTDHAPDKRPYVISRSASIGTQRYAQTWSGDNLTSWDALAYNLPMGLNLSLSGMPSLGHDVGGFAGGRPDAELFLRWVQAGIFSPRFTIHSLAINGEVNTPWMHPEILPHIRDLLRLRYRLIPYFYTLMVEAHRTGQPILRPLVVHFSADPQTHGESFAHLVGANLLVAPVIEPGATTRAVYLPRGADWCDWHTGAVYAGGQTVSVPAPLDARVPLLVRRGGLIPLATPRRCTREPDTVREVLAFPLETGRSQFALIEDDGETLAYQRGEQTAVTLSMESTAEGVRFGAVARGGYALPYTHITFVTPRDGQQVTVAVEQG